MDIQMQKFQICGKSFPKSVTGATDRLDEHTGRAELPPNLQDVLVESTARGKIVLPPYGVKERVTGEDLSRMCGKGLEESEFSDGQRLFWFARHAHEKAIRIYERVAYAKRAVSVGRARRGVGPAECRRDASKEFPNPERFGDEVVRAESKPDDAVCLRSLRGQEQYRDVRIAPSHLGAEIGRASCRERVLPTV